MRAIGLEQSDPGAALEAWTAWLARGGDKKPWAAHARQHIARLAKTAPKGKTG
jgi:hypothetical protein